MLPCVLRPEGFDFQVVRRRNSGFADSGDDSGRPLFGHRSGKQQKTHWVTFAGNLTSWGRKPTGARSVRNQVRRGHGEMIDRTQTCFCCAGGASLQDGAAEPPASEHGRWLYAAAVSIGRVPPGPAMTFDLSGFDAFSFTRHARRDRRTRKHPW